MKGKEFCRHRHALRKFLRNRAVQEEMSEGYSDSGLAKMDQTSPFESATSKKAPILFPGYSQEKTSLATEEDLKNYNELLLIRYLCLSSLGLITPEWRKFGERNTPEVEKLIRKGQKVTEASKPPSLRQSETVLVDFNR